MWRLFYLGTDVHTLLYRLSRGLVGHRMPGMPAMLLLDHVGAKSGKARTTPLVYIEDGDAFVIVASKGGHPKHPAWFHNLRANPETTIQVGPRKIPVTARVATWVFALAELALHANPETTIQVGSRRIPVTARVATDAERERLWPEVVRAYSGYEGYQRRTDRKIPLVMLEPR